MSESIKVEYEFVSDHIWSDIQDCIHTSGVKPITVTVHTDRLYDNVEMIFANRELAIQFTETYLVSDDPADIMEYVGPEL